MQCFILIPLNNHHHIKEGQVSSLPEGLHGASGAASGPGAQGVGGVRAGVGPCGPQPAEAGRGPPPRGQLGGRHDLLELFLELLPHLQGLR